MYVAEIRKRNYRGKTPLLVQTPEDVYRLLRKRFKGLHREHFLAILLSARNGVIGIETVSVGSLNASIVHPREVFKPAILASAAAIVLSHNHPSGDPDPSEDDLAITRRLKEAGELIGIQILDHVVIGNGRFRSLKESGQL